MRTDSNPGVYRSLDAWRGLAALLVIFFHNAEHLKTAFPGSESSGAGWWFDRGYLGVELFYVISGYCIASAMTAQIARSRTIGAAVGVFAKARLRRIYPTYWAALGIMIVVGVVLRHGAVGGALSGAATTGVARNSSDLGPVNILESVTLASGAFGRLGFLPVAWTLCYEVAFYAIVGIGALSLARRSVDTFLGLLHGLTLASIFGLVVSPVGIGYPMDMWPLFGLGALVYDGVRRPRATAPRVLFGLAAVGMLTLSAFPTRQFGPHGVREAIWFVLPCAGLLWMLFAHDAKVARLRGVRWLAWVGTFSYSLYLIGYLGGGFADVVARHVRAVDDNYGAHFVLRTVFAVLCGWAFYLMCERPMLSRQRARRIALATA